MIAIAKNARQVSLLLCGAVAGIALALPVAYFLQVRAGEDDLLRYALCVLRVEERSAQEFRGVVAQMQNDNLPFCSDDEIALMRRIVYNAVFVKDVGRVKDDLLYCTSGGGRLDRPLHESIPSLSVTIPDLKTRTDVTPRTKLTVVPGSTGIVIVNEGVSVVVNPDLYLRLDNPPMEFSGLLYDRERQIVVQGVGHPEVLSTNEVLAQQTVEHEGVVYRPVCSGKYAVCAVAFERKSDILARSRGYFTGFGIVGALMGMCVVGLIVLYLQRQRSFEGRLRRAVHQREVTAVYQPIVELESGAIVGAEALARWTDESGEPVLPDVFIPVAEAKGFVGEITRLMIDHTIHDFGGLLDESGFHVTINISTEDLSDPKFFAHLEEGIARSGARPGALGFELTERYRTDASFAKGAIARLREAGHAIYIDDFGTGYSSLAYLHDLHVDAIKIDRVFTQTIGTGAVTGCVVPQIIDIAMRLGLTVVVEGVETSEQADYFRHAAAGVLGQGWFLGRPVPAAEFKSLLADRRKGSPV